MDIYVCGPKFGKTKIYKGDKHGITIETDYGCFDIIQDDDNKGLEVRSMKPINVRPQVRNEVTITLDKME